MARFYGTGELNMRCKICIDEQGERIVETVDAEDEVELLDHAVKEHYNHPEVKHLVKRYEATTTCKNCGEEFITEYDTAGIGILVESHCPMCRHKDPLTELTVSRVPTEEFYQGAKASD